MHVELRASEQLQTREEAFRAWQMQRDLDDRNWRDKTRKEDRRSQLINLVLSALVAILTTVATLIAANKLPWFRNDN